MKRGMSIRLRLTLLYSGILALTLLTFGSILYVTQSHATYRSIRANLVRQARFYSNDDQPRPGSPDRLPSSLPAPSDVEAGSTGRLLPGRWTQTLDLSGNVTGYTVDLSGVRLPLSPEGLQAVQDGGRWFETAEVDGEPLLIYSLKVATPEGAPEIVQVAFPIAQSRQALNALRLILVAGSSLVFLAALAAGWVLAGAALRPIHRITSTAREIGAEHNFGRRVEHTGPADEVGQLAVTFNEMLAELETGYRQLESSLRSQRRFVADASHELRTPLTTVRGNVELLGREPPIDPAERAEVLADTAAEVERLIRLVHQLLTLARADAGQPLRREPIALGPLLEDVARQAQQLTPGGQVACQLPAGPVTVVGDRDALKQVLLILIDNAHVHTPPGTPISVYAGLAGDRAAICVHDTGPGIAPEVLEHIFERFYQGDPSRRAFGAGLGLAIARELVEAQDGTISVESRLGQGCLFTVTLPRVAA